MAFTEHGALMAASVLNSEHAIQTSVYVARAFVRLCETLDELERKAEALSTKHDALAADTQAQFRQVIEALRQLMSPPVTKGRPIGFVTPK